MIKIHYNLNDTDICSPHKMGKESLWVCEIGHSYPGKGYLSRLMSRNCYVLHYIKSGCGYYRNHPVEAPCVFLMRPDETQYYTVSDDPKSPQWEQYWIMFSGPAAEGYLREAGFGNEEQSVFPCPYINQAYHILHDLQSIINYTNHDDRFYMLTGLFRLFSLHSATSHPTAPGVRQSYSRYVQTICDYIQENYAQPLCEDDLAAIVHLSTRYMHRIFKQELGISPIRYLNAYRVQCAKRLLTELNLPVNQTAEAVGFSDPNYFCCVFQRFTDGLSPMEYKKKHHLKLIGTQQALEAKAEEKKGEPRKKGAPKK